MLLRFPACFVVQTSKEGAGYNSLTTRSSVKLVPENLGL
jgi:hypothetical protein